MEGVELLWRFPLTMALVGYNYDDVGSFSGSVSHPKFENCPKTQINKINDHFFVCPWHVL